MEIPVIDMTGFDRSPAARERIAGAWDAAFRSAGFCSLVGHGIERALSDRLYGAALEFFALPLGEKLACREPGVRGEGYIPFEGETVGRTMGAAAAPDIAEAMQFVDLHSGRDRALLWPPSLPALRPLAERYALEASMLVRKIMTISALALELPPDAFDPFFATMTTKLRLVLYPDQLEEPLPGQLRNAAHTDFAGFTILRQDNAPGGLQVHTPDGEWTDVAPVDDAFVINAGDLIQRWTNDRWRSNVHRVVNPGRGHTGSTQRLSIVVFTGPDPEAEIACLPTCLEAGATPKYPPVNAAEHVREKVRITLGA